MALRQPWSPAGSRDKKGIMDVEERQRLATERAEIYAPKPSGGSFMAGICVATVVLLGDAAVSRFYGWRIQDHLWVALIVTTAGFFVGLIAHKRLGRRSRKARRAERTQIDLDQDQGPQ
jgi:hypothetical protein